MENAVIDRPGSEILMPHEFSLELYRKVLTVFYVEERMKTFARQGKCSFVASSRGHEMTQVTITSLLKPGHDWFSRITARRPRPLLSAYR